MKLNFKRKRKFLIEIESGKNNIAKCPIHIMRGSFILKALDEEEAMEEVFKKALYSSLKHYGFNGDWVIVKNITKL